MTRLPPLLEPHELNALLEKEPSLLLIDLSADETWLQGHIPSAVHVSPARICCGYAPAPGKLPSKAALEELLGSIGYQADRPIVVYDDAGSSWAGRMIWTLDLIGHTNAALLNGGVEGWAAAGFPLSREKPSVAKNRTAISINPELVAEKEEILQHLGDANYRIWDARSEEEYHGHRVLAERGGHIPGAIWLEWTDLLDGCRIRPVAEIQAMLDAAGLTRDKTIVTHCQAHRRSGLTYFVAKKLLNYPAIKAYPGSWSEWGNLADTPIEY